MSFETFGSLYPAGGGDGAGGAGDAGELPEITGSFRPGYFVCRFQAGGVAGTLNNDVHEQEPPEAPEITGGPWAFL